MQVGKGVTLKNVMMMGGDYYEGEQVAQSKGLVPLGVGDGSHIENAILDKNARIGKNVSITNKEGIDEWEPAEGEESAYCIRSGIVVVMRGGVIPDGTEI